MLRLYNDQQQLIRSWQQPIVTEQDAYALGLRWDQLRFVVTPDLSATESGTGYLEVQLLNRASQPMYFDSLTVRHPVDRVLVSQEQHYYPFGLALSGVAVNTLAQPQVSKDQFNGGSELQDVLLGSEQGVYSTFFRNYDPATGRFQGLDPLADSYADWNPYSFSFNDPVNFNDPNGDEPIIVNGRHMNPRDMKGAESWAGSSLDYMNYQIGGAGVSVGYGGSANFINSVIAASRNLFSGFSLTNQNGQLGYFRSFSGYDYSGPVGMRKGTIALGGVKVGVRFVTVQSFSLGGIYNNSENLIVWFRPDEDVFVNGIEYKTSKSYAIKPGGYWPHGVDGITVSNCKNTVYKIKNGADVIGIRVNNNEGFNLGYKSLNLNWINNTFGSGFKGFDYLKKLQSGKYNIKNGKPEGDNSWNILFKNAIVKL